MILQTVNSKATPKFVHNNTIWLPHVKYRKLTQQPIIQVYNALPSHAIFFFF